MPHKRHHAGTGIRALFNAALDAAQRRTAGVRRRRVTFRVQILLKA